MFDSMEREDRRGAGAFDREKDDVQRSSITENSRLLRVAS